MNLTGRARLLLWDFERGSLPYDIVCVVLLLLLILVRPSWVGDPMALVR